MKCLALLMDCVSILVLMDVAFELLGRNLLPYVIFVSILVLMDVAFEFCYLCHVCRPVNMFQSLFLWMLLLN